MYIPTIPSIHPQQYRGSILSILNRPSPLSIGLEAYWTLDETSGGASDSYGSNHLVQNGTVGSVAGKIGNARTSFSISNYLSIAHNDSLAVQDIDFTISAWVNIPLMPSATRWILGKFEIGERVYAFQLTSNNRFQFMVSSDGSSTVNVLSGSQTGLSGWFHLIGWHDSINNVIGLSVNGVETTAPHSAGLYTAGNSAFVIGTVTAGTGFVNPIDEVGFWKRLLTPEERSYLYNAGNGLTYPFV